MRFGELQAETKEAKQAHAEAEKSRQQPAVQADKLVATALDNERVATSTEKELRREIPTLREGGGHPEARLSGREGKAH